MPWYYAAPDAKPIGPVTLDELHARRVQGAVGPDTYIIEQNGAAGDAWAWKRYQEVFPASAVNFPPLPALPPPPSVAPAFPATQAHPLFPSAAPAPAQHPVFSPAARPDPYYHVKPTNSSCAWGFGLGLTSFFFAFACGLGALLAIPALLLCIVGLTQVQKNRAQGGHGLAVAGLVLSGLALIISLIFILSLAIPMIKEHGFTVTEQTTNDSE